VSPLLSFRRSSADDLQRLWDSVGELKEATNVTARNVEDLYDKDLLQLQEFRAKAEAQLGRIKQQEKDEEEVKQGVS